jgi:homoserine O-acetyltransferase/O-succinyltransferase
MMSLVYLILFLFSRPLLADVMLKEKKVFTLPFYTTLEGKKIESLKVGYETYGTLNSDQSNAILITHHFSGNSHAAGKYKSDDPDVGYWDSIIGPSKVFDTNKYFIIASDTLVNITPSSPKTVTTGPASINPKTKKPYALSFPLVSLEDFVHVQKSLVDSLGIKKLTMVAGASGGAAQAMQWAASFPENVDKVLCVIGPGLKMPDYTIALLNLWSMPIKLDPHWKKGNYYSGKSPSYGVAESLKMITFSALSFEWAESFKREKESGSTLTSLESRYKIEAYLDERAHMRAKMVDANSLLYTAKAIQTFDVENKLKEIKAKILFIPVESDLIFPASLSLHASKILCENKIKSSVSVLNTSGGHLDGLFKIQERSAVMAEFLNDQLEFCR